MTSQNTFNKELSKSEIFTVNSRFQSIVEATVNQTLDVCLSMNCML